MSNKPKKISNAKTQKPAGSAPKAGARKAAKSEATAKADASATSKDAGDPAKASAPAREISYFSAVVSDDYRSGWDNIFGGSKGKKTATRTKSAVTKKRASVLPLTITLDSDDFDASIHEALESVLHRHAKKKRLNFDKLARNGQVSWQLYCRISNA
jgi:hypothetical protein